MKKTLTVFLSFLLLFCLSSCATEQKDVELSQDRACVQAIEIFKPDRAYYEGDIHSFLEENEPLAVVKSESYKSFLDDLSHLEFEEEKAFFPIPMDGGYDYDGYVIAVIYSDGGYDIIAERGLYSYAVSSDGDGRHKYDHSDYCGETPWSEFVEKYLEN